MSDVIRLTKKTKSLIERIKILIYSRYHGKTFEIYLKDSYIINEALSYLLINMEEGDYFNEST